MQPTYLYAISPASQVACFCPQICCGRFLQDDGGAGCDCSQHGVVCPCREVIYVHADDGVRGAVGKKNKAALN